MLFGEYVRQRQLKWALAGNIPADALEERHGKTSWVLKRDQQKQNLFQETWWQYIEGKEHRWARALNSSQCFAVNVFAPMRDDPVCARAVLQSLLPSRDILPQDDVSVDFESTPKGAPEWLGERGQPTQIDVYLQVTRSGRCIGHVLVEVKFTEPSFGCCRGWKAPPDKRSRNPDRCLQSSEIVSSPDTNCWLAENEGRKYWRIMSAPGSSIRQDAVRAADPCPFRYGLYQMMRNRVLADELARQTGAEWSEFVVCRHPGNEQVTVLKESVSSVNDAIEAFQSLSSKQAVLEWNPAEIVRIIAAFDDRLKVWGMWMTDRYFG